MADDKTPLGMKQDRKLISLKQDYEVRYWTEALGVSRERLEDLVNTHGHSAEKVREALRKEAALIKAEKSVRRRALLVASSIMAAIRLRGEPINRRLFKRKSLNLRAMIASFRKGGNHGEGGAEGKVTSSPQCGHM